MPEREDDLGTELELRGERGVERAEPSREQVRSAWKELARFLPDVARLLWRLARDPRVPWTGKVAAAGAVAYVVTPVDFIPDFIPVAGQFDDVVIVGRALRFLFRSAGYELIRELWEGTDEGFAALLVVAGMR